MLDLDYDEDSSADADANFVLTDGGEIVEIQATAEKTAFKEADFLELLALARKGTDALFIMQRQALVRLMVRKLARGQQLVLASHNTGKLREIEALLRPLRIDVVSAAALGLPEPVEDAPDFIGNARIKAAGGSDGQRAAALSDDSGFCVAALHGAPGVLLRALGRAIEGFRRRDGDRA